MTGKNQAVFGQEESKSGNHNDQKEALDNYTFDLRSNEDDDVA